MFHNAIVKHAAAKYLSGMMFAKQNAAKNMFQSNIADMFQDTIGNMLADNSKTAAQLQHKVAAQDN
jgi:hypothetical protein